MHCDKLVPTNDPWIVLSHHLSDVSTDIRDIHLRSAKHRDQTLEIDEIFGAEKSNLKMAMASADSKKR